MTRQLPSPMPGGALETPSTAVMHGCRIPVSRRIPSRNRRREPNQLALEPRQPVLEPEPLLLQAAECRLPAAGPSMLLGRGPSSKVRRPSSGHGDSAAISASAGVPAPPQGWAPDSGAG